MAAWESLVNESYCTGQTTCPIDVSFLRFSKSITPDRGRTAISTPELADPPPIGPASDTILIGGLSRQQGSSTTSSDSVSAPRPVHKGL
jgi:hypothetical protein